MVTPLRKRRSMAKSRSEVAASRYTIWWFRHPLDAPWHVRAHRRIADEGHGAESGRWPPAHCADRPSPETQRAEPTAPELGPAQGNPEAGRTRTRVSGCGFRGQVARS